MIEENEYPDIENYIEQQIESIRSRNEAITILQKLVYSCLKNYEWLHYCVLERPGEKERVLAELKRIIEPPQDLMVFESAADFCKYWDQNRLKESDKKIMVFIFPDAGNCETGKLLNSLGLAENREYFDMQKLISALQYRNYQQ